MSNVVLKDRLNIYLKEANNRNISVLTNHIMIPGAGIIERRHQLPVFTSRH